MEITLILPVYGNRFPLAALYLTAGLEKSNHSALLKFFDTRKFTPKANQPSNFALIEELVAASCHIVAIGCMVDLLPYILFSLRKLKKKHPDKVFILGGAGPSELAEEIIGAFPEIDYIVKDKDPAILGRLLTAIEEKSGVADVHGVVFRGDRGIEYTSSNSAYFFHLEFPRRHTIGLDGFRNFSLITGDGCPYRCTFCSSKPFLNEELRYRSFTHVINEINWIKKQRGELPHIIIVDEAFVVDSERVFTFCDILKNSVPGLEWACYGRANCMDEPLMAQMSGSGCTGIFFGIESGSNHVLKKIKKEFTIEHAVKIVLTAKKYFNHITASFIWGFPFETFEDFNRTLSTVLYLRHNGIHVNLKLLYPVKESEIYTQYSNDLIFSEYGRDSGHMFLGSEPDEFTEFVKTYRHMFPRYSIYMHSGFREKVELLRKMIFPGIIVPDDDISGAV